MTDPLVLGTVVVRSPFLEYPTNAPHAWISCVSRSFCSLTDGVRWAPKDCVRERGRFHKCAMRMCLSGCDCALQAEAGSPGGRAAARRVILCTDSASGPASSAAPASFVCILTVDNVKTRP